MHMVLSQPKKRLERSVIAQSKWVTFYKDRVESNRGGELEYWCVDRSDSVIIVAVQNGKFLLPPEQYRPGIDQITLDFPGGRIDALDPNDAAIRTVRRELQLDESVQFDVTQITPWPLIVDSAFSNQRVFGYVAVIPDDVIVQNVRSYTADELLDSLHCLQCRTFLLEYLRDQDKK